MNYYFKLFTLIAMVSLFTTSAMSCSSSDDDNGGGTTNVEFKVTKADMAFSNTGGTTSFSVQAPQKPTVTSDASWLTVTAGPTTSTTVYPFTVTADENEEVNDRSATITVTVSGSSKTITVTQTSSDGLVITSAKSVSVAADGGEVTIALQANGQYEMVISSDWISQSNGANTRTNMKDYSETFTVAKNNGGERSATISFSLNNITESVTVTQESGLSGTGINATAMEIAKNMYPGWNLGNTMEATGGETSWQRTKTSQEIIDFVKSKGFKSVRIPCSWYIHSSDETIDAAWMARVKEIVDYCIADGLYVLLNDHWDSGWIEVEGFSASTASYQAVSEATISAKIATLQNLWTQIANTFKGYDEHLLFAGLNEPFQQYNLFNNKHKELTPILERYNQAFIDAVRATGGNNANRTLVVQAPGTNISSATDTGIGFDMPNDVEGCTMVEVHYYDPWDFCGDGGTNTWFWGSGNHVSGSSHNATWGEESHLKSQFVKMKAKFVDKGYPVIIGECGVNWRKLSENQTQHNSSVKSWFKEVCLQAGNNGLVPMVWDINSPNQNGENGTMTILNRSSLSVFCQPAMDGITEGVATASWPY
ncbi:MAG: cellulase family glycosylhydrolase [Bacteroidaceae bacterium]|nr:cellulase family glycosylhydrolase [Bacteroidaceae bacterium]